MESIPPLTIFLGPQTQLALSLNSVVRRQRSNLHHAGLKAWPSRMASPFLRKCLDDRPKSQRLAEFNAEISDGPMFLSAVNFLGVPSAAYRQREILPDAEKALISLNDLVSSPRIVLAIDQLPEFFLAANSAPLEARVANTDWEIFYELSWADLVQEVADALPDAEILVLAQDAVSKSDACFRALFGAASDKMANPLALLRDALTKTGQEKLEDLPRPTKPTKYEILLSKYRNSPSSREIEERLNFDKVTQSLLKQRFEEDLAAISSNPRCEVLW